MKPRTPEEIVESRGDALAKVALEMNMNEDTAGEGYGEAAAGAVMVLCAAIMAVASLNNDPGRVIKTVVGLLERAADRAGAP